jgi:Transport protein particle (TRAPP) component
VIKFLCKDLWTIAFRKQIDNLKTNHRGIYVLTDNTFKPLSRMSMEKGRDPQGMMMQAQPVRRDPLLYTRSWECGVEDTRKGEVFFHEKRGRS